MPKNAPTLNINIDCMKIWRDVIKYGNLQNKIFYFFCFGSLQSFSNIFGEEPIKTARCPKNNSWKHPR